MLRNSLVLRNSLKTLSTLSSPSTANHFNYLTNIFDRFLSTSISNLKSLLQIHAFTITTGHSNNFFIAAKLISYYSAFNKPISSTQVFDSINPKDTFLWNSIIKTHFSNGNYTQAIDHYLQMRRSNVLPNTFTIPMVVSSLAELSYPLEMGRSTHCTACKIGLFGSNSAVGSSFIYLYAKQGEIDDASNVFEEMPARDVVTWTALVIGYVQNDENEKGLTCLCEMHKRGEDGETPNFRTVGGGLQACGNLGSIWSGKCLHGHALKTGISCFPSVQSSLLSVYSKCGTVEEADLAYCELYDKDLVSWTMMIGVYARNGYIFKCLELFWEMQVSKMTPDGTLVSCMLSGFGNTGRVYDGKAFHGVIIRRNFEFDQMVSNSLLSMYCNLGCLDIAEKLFGTLSECNPESWNTMISGYGMKGLGTKCLELFRVMQHLGMESDITILVTVISSCSRLMSQQPGRSVHCYALKNRVDESISLNNSLLGMYGKLGNLTMAERIFYRSNRDIVTWNSLLSSYTQNEQPSKALALFDQMILTNIEPNSVTFVTVLSACSHLADLDYGMRVHTCAKERGLEYDLPVATALVDMYVKSGNLEKSREIFNLVPERDVVLWNVMMSGYGIHGDAKSTIEVFQQMEESGMKPNGLTFLAIMSACTHSGLVEEGKYYFSKMNHYSVVPTLKHYACMVDLLGRSGNLNEAELMIQSMPIAPDGGMWGALLGACKTHNDFETGRRVAQRAIEADPENDGYYIILSNLYSSLGKWEEAQEVRRTMKNMGVRKQAGWSAA